MIEVKFETRRVYGHEMVFTRDESPDAEFKNGSRVKKAWSEPNDGTPLGTEGSVIGSISIPEDLGKGVAYFIEWDNRPGMYVFVIAPKLGAA